jgi:anti-anti-sigma factor
LQIDKQLDGRTARLNLQGELSIYCAAALQATLLAALAESDALELELSSVTELDTAAFQQLYLARREALGVGKSLRITAHSPATREVFELYRADDFFELPADA